MKIKNMEPITSSKIVKMSPQLLVADIGRAVDFYTDKLGFSVEFQFEDFYASVIKDGFAIHLKEDKSSADFRQFKRSNEHLDVTFSVEDIAVLFEELSGKSIEIVQPLREMPYGREFYIADLDGNLIGFFEA